MRTILALLVLASSAEAGTIIYTNTTGVDWKTQPVDIRLPSNQQPGTEGLMWFSEQLSPNHSIEQGLSAIGDDWSIGVFEFRHGAGKPSAFWPYEDPQGRAIEWVSDAYLGSWSPNLRRPATIRVMEQDGPHYGWLVTDAETDVITWGYETRPNTTPFWSPALLRIPEPSTLLLVVLGALALTWRVR